MGYPASKFFWLFDSCWCTIINLSYPAGSSLCTGALNWPKIFFCTGKCMHPLENICGQHLLYWVKTDWIDQCHGISTAYCHSWLSWARLIAIVGMQAGASGLFFHLQRDFLPIAELDLICIPGNRPSPTFLSNLVFKNKWPSWNVRNCLRKVFWLSKFLFCKKHKICWTQVGENSLDWHLSFCL